MQVIKKERVLTRSSPTFRRLKLVKQGGLRFFLNKCFNFQPPQLNTFIPGNYYEKNLTIITIINHC